jgi:hypothetical protein
MNVIAKMLFSTGLILVSPFLAVQAAVAQQRPADCFGDSILFVANQDVRSDLTVRKGRSCGRTMSGGQTQVTSIQFLQQPRHGTLRRAGRIGYLYAPRKGFTGQDQFKVRYVGYRVDDRGNKAFDVFFGVLTNVTVVP